MSAISNNTILADNEPSVCIPRVFANIDRKRIHNVFQTIFGPDVVSQIDMVSRTSENGEEYSRVFVHFTKWPKTMYAQQVRQKLLNGDKVKVVYDEPWYWYMSASRVERPQAPPRAREVSAPYIDLDDSSSSSVQNTKKMMDRGQRVQRDVPQLVPRQVAMKGGAGSGYDERIRVHHQEQERRPRVYDNDYKTKGNDYYAQDSRRPSSHHYRDDDYVPRYQNQNQHHQRPQYRNKSKIFTPRTPEIKEWTEKKDVPGAPMKSKGCRPVLMLDDDEDGKKMMKTSRKLELEKTTTAENKTEGTVSTNESD